MFLVKMDLRISGEFHVFPSRNMDVRTEVEGLVTEILVKEGDTVTKGTVIAKLSDRDSRAELAKTRAEIAQLDAKRQMLQVGPARAWKRSMWRGSRSRQLDPGEENALRQYEEAQQMHTERLAKAKSTLEKAQERVKYKNMEVLRLRSLGGHRADRTKGLGCSRRGQEYSEQRSGRSLRGVESDRRR